ncbi:MAG: 4-oxalocrotonate tautomerase family protein [Proteobacteria bacterium]|jgi:4-oxalocrotonate tautomerase|nr:4-oxalocrotonate tautomerase family protein [Alphaproteobacteria bacterium]NCC03730.1 4-oxalocrotonate tautomerase family protein [Pseudomonadota bacterium]
MPIVHIDILKRPVAAKRKLARAVTDAIVSSLGVSPESICLVIHEMAAEDYSVAGELYADKKATKPPKSKSQIKKRAKK